MPESSPDGWIGRYDAAIGLSKFFFFCPDEIHEFDLGSWILKMLRTEAPHKNRGFDSPRNLRLLMVNEVKVVERELLGDYSDRN